MENGNWRTQDFIFGGYINSIQLAVVALAVLSLCGTMNGNLGI